MVIVQIRGARRTQKILQGLPQRHEKEIILTNGQFMKNVRKSAKLRAPRNTGALADSIYVRKKGKNWILVVESPYGRYQDQGYKPHWIHALLPTKNQLGTVGKAFNTAGFVFVSKFKPFITPALEINIAKLPSMLAKGTKKAITGGK